jgi:adenylate cyclase
LRSSQRSSAACGGGRREALAHGGDDATALAVASPTILHLGHDFEVASGAIVGALALNSSCATVYHFGAHIHALSGDPAIAEDFAGKALWLTPFDPVSHMALHAVGTVRLRQRRFDEAVAAYSKAVQANPRFSTLYILHASALAQADREEEAKLVTGRLLALEPNFRLQPLMAVFSPFFDKTLAELLLAGLRKAGLPE